MGNELFTTLELYATKEERLRLKDIKADYNRELEAFFGMRNSNPFFYHHRAKLWRLDGERQVIIEQIIKRKHTGQIFFNQQNR